MCQEWGFTAGIKLKHFYFSIVLKGCTKHILADNFKRRCLTMGQYIGYIRSM